ncbi:MAG: hypothetical protein JSW50_06250 [Candidatus Latescibacterota bacterium]|nr:MAG: hypothetical protein JSW50_06250 [Candidatus Latescibacterota bacterium]
MFRLCINALAMVFVAVSISPCLAQDTTQVAPDTSQVLDTTSTATPTTIVTQTEEPMDTRSFREKIYFGGSIGLSFGNYTAIRIAPLAAYKLRPKLSVGLQIGYEYVRDSRYSETLTSHNYGGSIFSRYRIIPQVFAHAEYALVNYEIHTSLDTSERRTVPFLFLGGGYSQQVAPGTWMFVQVLFDVLQNNDSPYDDWEPFFSIGVGVGF